MPREAGPLQIAAPEVGARWLTHIPHLPLIVSRYLVYAHQVLLKVVNQSRQACPRLDEEEIVRYDTLAATSVKYIWSAVNDIAYMCERHNVHVYDNASNRICY